MAQIPNIGWMQRYTTKISGALIGAIMSMGAMPNGADAKKVADEIAEIVEQKGNELAAEQAENMANQLSAPTQSNAINNFGTTQGNDNSEDRTTTNHLADDMPDASPADMPELDAPPAGQPQPPKPAAQDPGYIGDEEAPDAAQAAPETQRANEGDATNPQTNQAQDPANPQSMAQNNVGQVDDAAQQGEAETAPTKERGALTQGINSMRFSKQLKELEKQNQMDQKQLGEAQKPLKELDKKIAKKEKERTKIKLLVMPIKIARFILLVLAALLTITIIFFFFIPIAQPLFAAAFWLKRIIKRYNGKIKNLDEEISKIKKEKEKPQQAVDSINKRIQQRQQQMRQLQNQSLLARQAA